MKKLKMTILIHLFLKMKIGERIRGYLLKLKNKKSLNQNILNISSIIFNKSKMPRDRLNKTSTSMLKKTNHLAAPMLGMTVGHGLDKGFNPYVLE